MSNFVLCDWHGNPSLTFSATAEPDHNSFFARYEQYIQAFHVDLPPLTGQMLRDEIYKMKESSPVWMDGVILTSN